MSLDKNQANYWLEILQFHTKKAVEQEFSRSGLFISLSIAFFIVIADASLLRLAYVSMKN